MIDRELNNKICRVAEMITGAENIVVFTGAGISTESGIPDFRSPGGIWTTFDPDDFTIETYRTNPDARRRQWRFLLSGDLFQNARPNAAHEAIAGLEKLGRLNCVITQNIDNLHQEAGNISANVFELHGNMRWIRCLDCGQRYPADEILRNHDDSGEIPPCGRCAGILKPDVILFGEALPEETLREATRRASRCDLLLVVGSSLVVYPAAGLPLFAKRAGARLVIVNLSETPADRMADVVIRAPAGKVMGQILNEVRQRISGSCA